MKRLSKAALMIVTASLVSLCLAAPALALPRDLGVPEEQAADLTAAIEETATLELLAEDATAGQSSVIPLTHNEDVTATIEAGQTIEFPFSVKYNELSAFVLQMEGPETAESDVSIVWTLETADGVVLEEITDAVSKTRLFGTTTLTAGDYKFTCTNVAEDGAARSLSVLYASIFGAPSNYQVALPTNRSIDLAAEFVPGKTMFGSIYNGESASNGSFDETRFYQFALEETARLNVGFRAHGSVELSICHEDGSPVKDAAGNALMLAATEDNPANDGGLFEAYLDGNHILPAGNYLLTLTSTEEDSWNEPFWIGVDISPQQFSDVPLSAWHAQAVDFAVELGLITGYSGTDKFGPNDLLTRAQAAAILCRYFEPEIAALAQENATGMADVADGKWYTASVNWVVENGIMEGVEVDGELRFDVNGTITRQELCVIIEKAAAAMYDEGIQDGFDSAAFNAMPDAGAVDPEAADAVAWALDKGVISGEKKDGQRFISPDNAVSRAVMVTVMMNAYDNYVI